jgi:ATP-dependent Clp protease ATP-binding subunit ClpC
MAMDSGENLRAFLRKEATPALVGVIGDAMARAESAGMRTHLAHVIDRLLEEESVRARVPEEVRTRARAALSDQIKGFPLDGAQAGKFAFSLADLTGPASAMARDVAADRVSPLIFLATCLSASIELDADSGRTREVLRAGGLTHEALMPKAAGDAVRRADFTFQSLGVGTDITAMARAGFWATCPLVGMEAELTRLAVVLASMNYSAAVVGEPGVGKSAFIQGFAWHIAHRTRPLIPPDMDSWTVVMIEAVDVLKGTSGRGELETRVKDMLAFFRKNPTVVPFFEEVHRLLDTDDSSSRSVATALKPPMANGLFRCAGVTTDKEYARFIASDEAMNSRFRKILLPEPDAETAARIIAGAKGNLIRAKARELGIDFDEEAIRAAVRVTSTYQKSDRLPRKAINLLGEAVGQKVYDVVTAPDPAAVSRTVTAQDVSGFFSAVSGIPVDDLGEDRSAYYSRLAERLNAKVKGQPRATAAATGWLGLHASGWVDPRRPRGRFLFLGPPGVGKTELAMCLAEEVLRDRGSVITMNMADFSGEGARTKFMGADPGYVGFGQTSTIFSKVMMRPYSVVVLDEIEKAHPSLAEPLMSVLDGRGEDSQGRFVDFSQCIFVMTSNAIMGPLMDSLREHAGASAAREEDATRRLLVGMGGIWTAPLVDRIDRLVVFEPLGRETLMEILDMMVEARRKRATRALPAEIDTPAAREAILAAAREGEHASARRLERALLGWLAAQAAGVAAG